jgi:hypothetical protein
MTEVIWGVFKWAMFLLGCFTALGIVVALTFIWVQDRE